MTGSAADGTRGSGGPAPGGYDLAVIGAGPTGLAAAVTAADSGLSVVLIDASERPGGQYFRHAAPGLAPRGNPVHHKRATFAALSARLAAHVRGGRITRLPRRHVWTAEESGPAAGPERWTLRHVPVDGAPAAPTPADGIRVTRARCLLLATGAYERQLPFPGWTLPGVVAAGGAQAILKDSGALPGRRIVVAGSGPLLTAFVQAIKASQDVVADGSGGPCRPPRTPLSPQDEATVRGLTEKLLAEGLD
ncbi:FAD-dependent oxidoreductase OS=Streptomyces microflavus OX=1919 GN=HUT09_27735 PE=4 SV=1 [Streptomyces microflavus]